MSVLEKQISDHKPLYGQQAALDEANRCLYCYDAPCITACPTGIDVPLFIRQIAHRDIKGAAQTIWNSNPLGYSCARVCPVEVLCVGSCVYNHAGEEPIQIGKLQRFATENAMTTLSAKQVFHKRENTHPKRVALIGGGPASLTAAVLLAAQGHKATIFEKTSSLGGLNALGIAPYKLQFDDAQKEIDWLLGIGINVKTNINISSLKPLLDEYDAVFIGIGLGPDTRLLRGQGIWGATHLIESIKTDPTLELRRIKHACVIGGGNTAIDVAHELALLGLKHVTVLYRKDLSLMSGYEHERLNAQQDGVQFRGHCELVGVRRTQGQLSEIILSDDSVVPCQLLVSAIGQSHDDDTLKRESEHPRVWKAGDFSNGGKEVVNAVQEAKLIVQHMLESWSNTCPI